MLNLWPHWQRPLFIIILPLLLFLLWKLWTTHEVKGIWRQLIPYQFQQWLIRSSAVQRNTSKLYKWLMSIVTFLTWIILLGPSWTYIKQPPIKINAPLVIVINMTQSMLSNDIAPNRLESTKQKVLDLLSVRKDAQNAIIVYAGSAHVVTPFSDDTNTIENLLSSLSPQIMPLSGQRADLAVEEALQLIKNTKQTKQAQILLITPDVTTNEQININRLLNDTKIPLNILGVGTTNGVPIKQKDGQFIRDFQGNIIISKLNEKALQQLAYHHSGHYAHITLNNNDINTLNLHNFRKSARQVEDKSNLKSTNIWHDQGYWFLLPLLLLVSLGARKGWLVCILFLITTLPTPAQAFGIDQLLLNKDQQGARLLDEDKPVEAAKKFNNNDWKAYSYYQAKDYKQAEQYFAQHSTSEGLYNYGNTLAQQGKYEEAIAAWDKAIESNPHLTQAIKNKKIVEDILKKQTSGQKQDSSGKNKKDQHDNDQKQDDQSKGGKGNNNSPSSDNKNTSSSANQEQQESNKQQENPQDQQKDQQSNKNSTPPEDNKDQKSNKKDDEKPSEEEKQDKTKGEKSSNKPSDKQEDASSRKNATDKKRLEESLENQGLQNEQKEILKKSLQKIPDDPSELLRRKFYYEQLRKQRHNNQGSAYDFN